jgi:hypothetical protein
VGVRPLGEALMTRSRSYPATPAGTARGLKDGEAAYLAGIGHRVKWQRGHGLQWLKGIPGWKGTCQLCGGVARIAPTGDGTAYRGFEGAMAKKFGKGPRRCTRGR